MSKKPNKKHYLQINENNAIGNSNNCNMEKTQLNRFTLPNQLINTPTVSVGEFTSTEEARSFPFPNRWCVQWSDQRMDEYKRQGIRVLVICDWGRQNDDQFKYVLATVKPNHILYWDFDDVRFDNSPNALQEYEGGLGQEVVELIHKIANTPMNNSTKNKDNNENNMKSNKKQIIRLTESDLHRVVEESVKRVLRENDYHGIPWSDSDDEEGRNFDWQLYTSNPYGNFGMENMNITDRNGELSMAAQSDVPSLKALGRNGATTTGKHLDALNKFTKRNWKDGRTRNGNFDLNGLLNRGIQQSYDSRKEKEKKERERKDSLNYNRMIKSADKRPLHHKGSLNREF